MPPAIYDRPTRELLKEMLQEQGTTAGAIIDVADVLSWFASHYPRLRPSSVKAYLVQASTNDGSRVHRPATSAKDDILFKVGPGKYRLYQPESDPAPIHTR